MLLKKKNHYLVFVKAAAFLLALDAADAAQILRNFTDREVTAISEEMTHMGEVNPNDMESVLKEYQEGDIAVSDIGHSS